jgi:hypothetical protein
MKHAYLNMAIAKGKESTEGADFKRYIGVAPCFIKSVNPTKAELEKIYGSTLEKEPEYKGEVEANGEKFQNVRITFITQPDAEKVGFNVEPISVTFFVQKRFRTNKDNTKVQVIDKYGRTAWVTMEQAKNHEIPVYSNGPANLDKDYRPAYVGEEVLTNFLIAYLNIPSVMKYNQTEKKWYLVDNPQDSECRLDYIEEYFKGNFSELKEAVALQPNNKVKVLFGVRTADDGRQYQTAFTELFLRNSVSDYSKLDAAVQERKNNGAYSTTEFKAVPFKEYTVESTSFEDTKSDLPFSPTSTSNPFDY